MIEIFGMLMQNNVDIKYYEAFGVINGADTTTEYNDAEDAKDWSMMIVLTIITNIMMMKVSKKCVYITK